MRLTMKERRTVTKAVSPQYRRASKKSKSDILNQFVESTGYNRVYAAYMLRGHGRCVSRPGYCAGRQPAPQAKRGGSQAHVWA